MNKCDLFRIAFHHPAAMYSILTETTYHSPIRRAIEQELVGIVSKQPKYVENNIRQFGWGESPCPAMTFETFSAVIDKTNFINDEYAMSRYRIDRVFKWWKHSFGTFTDDQAPAVYRMIDRFANSYVPPEKFIMCLISLLPETSAYDQARERLGEMFRKHVYHSAKLWSDKSFILYDFAHSETVAQWDITGKNFRTVYLNDEYCNDVKASKRKRLTAYYDRKIQYAGLAFALRTEDEFLEYWKQSTDAHRRILATMHGKISKSLLEKFLRKYSQNKPILNALLAHKSMTREELMVYVLRGNETAREIFNSWGDAPTKRAPKDL